MIDPHRPQRGRIVVVGLGRVGRRVVALLRRLGAEVAVITARSRDDWLEDARASGAVVLVGDGRDGRLLAKAGIDRADALVVATDGDLVNLEIALDARRARPDLPVVVRMLDQTLARHVERALGMRAIGVSTVAAPVFAAAALGDRVAGAFVLEGVPMVLRVAKATGEPVLERRDAWARRLAGKAAPAEPPRARLAELFDPIRRAVRGAPRGLRVIGLVLLFLFATSIAVFHFAARLSVLDAVYFVVTTVTTTGYGDISARDGGVAVQLYACVLMLLGSASTAVLYSFVTDFIVAERVEKLLGRPRQPTRDHVIVVGLGDVGSRVCSELSRSGVPYVVADRRADAERADAVHAAGAFFAGDARTSSVLEDAGVRQARGLVAATGDDAVNLGVALEAEAIQPGLRTVVRMFDPELARKLELRMGIDAVMSSTAIAAPMFVAAALYRDVLAATALADELVVLREIRVSEAADGKTAGELAAAERGIATLYARPAGSFVEASAGDRVTKGGRLVVTVRERLGPGVPATGAAAREEGI